LKKSNRKKKPIKILKKPAGSVWFGFYKPKTEKTEPNLNRKKPSQNQQKTEPKPSQTKKTKSNQFEPDFVLKNRIEPKLVSLNRFRFF
jgi:hypothetical protein